MFLYSQLREFPAAYSYELDDSSVAESLNKSDVGTLLTPRSSEIVTQQPAHSASEQTIDDRLRELTFKYEIEATLGKRLRLLKDYEIIIVCDDSGSMRTMVDGTDRTRWDELRLIVRVVLEIGTIFNANGIDIHFLNRQPIYNVSNPEAIAEAFSISPRGYTPLVRALKHIFQLPATQRGKDKKVLVFIATDGAPTDDKGKTNVIELERLMVDERRSETTHVMFLLCTDDPACVNYLTEWDRRMVNVDVTDDYKTEREKIRRFQGENYPFSLGDYIAKALVGAIDPEIDNLNEPSGANNVNGN